MKSRVIIISVLIIAIGGVSFGFVNKQHMVEKTNLDKEFASIKEVKQPKVNPDLSYLVKGRYSRPITIEKIQKAKLVSDLIEGYPNNWITSYISVEISTSCKNVKVNAESLNDVLSTEQKEMLNKANIGTDIVIIVKHNTKNAITNALVKSEMNVSLTVIPEIEAIYVGGYKSMIGYLKENSSTKIASISTKKIQFASLKFIVNKNGKAGSVMLMKTSGNTEVDNLLVDLIANMPKWIPAQNSKGATVNQEFEFTIGSRGGGC